MLKIIKTFLLILIFANTAFAANKVTISSAFEPKALTLGKRGLLNITVSGSKDAPTPTLPEIDGLLIRPLGTQHSIKMTNGETAINVTHSFTVIPQRTGEFSLPDFNWDINGQKYSVSSPTTKLSVSIQDSKTTEGTSESIDLKVTIDKDKVYVGQMIPITVALYVPINMLGQVTTFPKAEGNDFMSYGYQEPGRTQIENPDGSKKQVLSFETYITPLKSGAIPLQYKMNLLIQNPKPITQTRAGNNFFDSIFGNMIVNTTEEMDPISLPEIINVETLPTHGKPENFTGAIGEFSIDSFSVSNESAQIGDPITLKLIVKGSGNIDRISPPVLNPGENWKAYKPKSTFNKEDNLGFKGTKIFEYIIIPQNAKITETPPISFSFFNPKTSRYSELTPNPIALKIIPSSETNIQPNPIRPSTNQNTSNLSNETEILPIKLGIKKTVNSLQPLITKIFFTPTLIGIAIILGSLLFLIKKQKIKHSQDTAYLKQINIEKAIQTNLQKVKKAFANHNAQEFYHAASIVILEVVARQNLKSSQALNQEDIVKFLTEKSLPEEQISFVKTIFHTTDMLKFSGFSNEQKLTSESLKNFESLINELEKCC